MRPLEDLARARLAGFSSRRRRELYRAVEAAEAAVALFHRHRAGGRPVPHPIALTPFVVSRRLLPALARLADLVHRFQTQAPTLYRQNVSDFRALCPLSDVTAAWLFRFDLPERRWRLMIRPDVGLTGRSGGSSAMAPILFETNATALAGLYNHAAGVRILKQEVFPRLYSDAERRQLEDPPDLLALTVRWVLRAVRRLGRHRLSGVAFVDDRTPVTGYSELPRLVQAFASHGVRAVHGAPDELRLRRGAAHLGDAPVDVVYRDLAFEELGLPPARPGAPLAGFLERLRAGAVLPGLAGEFGHKGLLEALVRPEYQRLFSPSERRLLRAAVPWTRVLSARFTEDPAGCRVDLAEYARRHAGRLLIKPNVGSSGEGILLGREAPRSRWDARIEAALRAPGAWVVQERRPGTRRTMVYLRNGVAQSGPCYFSLGLFYAPGDLGLHCRVSRTPVVNVARRGALACAFLSR
jgi:hypothetical protein